MVDPEGKSLKERIVDALRRCKHDYHDPRQFYQRYFYFFRPLQAQDYLSAETDPRRNLLAVLHNGEQSLRSRDKLLPLSIKDIVDHWLATFAQRLNELPGDKWIASHLQQVIDSILDDVKPHPKMLHSDWQQKGVDLQLFLRWALLAGWSGPSNSVLMEILGQEITLQRLADASTIVLK